MQCRSVQHCKTATNVDLRRITCMLEQESCEILYFTPSWLEYRASATHSTLHAAHLHASSSRHTVVTVVFTEWSSYDSYRSDFVLRPVRASNLWSPWASGRLSRFRLHAKHFLPLDQAFYLSKSWLVAAPPEETPFCPAPLA